MNRGSCASSQPLPLPKLIYPTSKLLAGDQYQSSIRRRKSTLSDSIGLGNKVVGRNRGDRAATDHRHGLPLGSIPRAQADKIVHSPGMSGLRLGRPNETMTGGSQGHQMQATPVLSPVRTELQRAKLHHIAIPSLDQRTKSLHRLRDFRLRSFSNRSVKGSTGDLSDLGI